MVGVPALWQLLERKIDKNVSDAGVLVEKAFDVDRSTQSRAARQAAVGRRRPARRMFFPVHRSSAAGCACSSRGGSALPAETMKAFRGLGFNLYEGYGLTEASPVLTVKRPGDEAPPGLRRPPLPGIDVQHRRSRRARRRRGDREGPERDGSATSRTPRRPRETIVNGWLHTGDLGRFDADGNLFIVGRKKEMILGAWARTSIPTSSRISTAIRRTSRSCRSSGCPPRRRRRDRRDADRPRLRGQREAIARRSARRCASTQEGRQELAALQARQDLCTLTSSCRRRRRARSSASARSSRSSSGSSGCEEAAPRQELARGRRQRRDDWIHAARATWRRRSAARSRRRPRSRSSASTR